MTTYSPSERTADLAQAIRHHIDGRYDEAEHIYTRLHQANPQDEEVLYLLGTLCCDLGIFPQAIPFLDAALRLSPAFPQALQQLGVARKALARQLMEAGQYPQAIDAIRKAQYLDPGDVDLCNWIGLAYLQLGAYPLAERALQQAVAGDAYHTQARNNLGICFYEMGQLAEARACFEQVLVQAPNYDGARVNLANTLRILGDAQAARDQLRSALEHQPDSAEILNNLGAALQDNGETEEARHILQRALVLAPQSAQVQWNLALSELKLGDYKNGWKHFESRWEGCDNLRNAYSKPRTSAWCGESLQGKRLLLWAEQGFGDTLQFLRFAEDVERLGAIVIAEVQPELANLTAGVQGITQVVARGTSLPAFDIHCPLMSLPYLLKLTTPAAVKRPPYLIANAEKTAHWRERLSPFSGIKVGLTWAGKSRLQQAELAAIDARRSIALAQLEPLMSHSGANFFSLQKDGAVAKNTTLPLHDFSDEWADFADTAAFASNLDLIISVDTAVAHLAGAQGKPVWLLNRYDSCWRWQQRANESAWYPSLREFRQPCAGDWNTVIARVADELKALLSQET